MKIDALNPTRLRFVHCACLLVLLAGCAAVRIDVDVYKGPLANHEDVQLRQYATLAVAAKPVLAALRNGLQEKKRPGFTKGLDVQQRDNWIRDGYFDHEVAYLINGALSYYEDVTDRTFARDMAAMISAHDEFTSAYRRFVVDSRRDNAIADSIDRIYKLHPGDGVAAIDRARASLHDFARLQVRFIRGGRLEPGDPVNVCSKENTLRLPPGVERRLAPETQCACDRLQTKINALSPVEKKSLMRGANRITCAQGRGVNEAFLVMSNKATLMEYSSLLFGEINKDYIERVSEISTAFVQSREAMRDLWLRNVDLLEKMGDRQLVRQRNATAELLAKTTQPRALACFLTRPGAEQTNSIPNDLRRELSSVNSALFSTSRGAWTRDTYGASSDAIRRAATLHPIELAALLRTADTGFKNGADGVALTGCTAVSNDDERDILQPYSRSYGIARGPTLDEAFAKELAKAENDLRIAISAAAGFEEARPSDGINALTSAFFHALARARGDARDDKDVALARRNLEESLIVWAERVLVAVNHGALKEPSGNVPQIAREVAVLQAVANTILLHADDFRRRDAHEKRMIDRAGPEANAFKRAFDITPGQAYEDLLRELRVTIDRLSRESAALAKAKAEGKQPVSEANTKLGEKQGEVGKAETAAKQTLDTFATLAKTLPRSFPRADADAAKDARSIEQRVTAAAPSTADALLTSIAEWLDAEIKLAGTQSAKTLRTVRLENAKLWLTAKRPELVNIANKLREPAKATAAGLLEELRRKLRNDVEQAMKVTARLKEEQALLQTAATKLGTQETALTATADYSAVREILVQLRGDVLKKADDSRVTDAAALMPILTDTLQKARDAQAQDKRAPYDLALKVVKDTVPPQALALTEIRPGDRRTQRDVFDDVLALLRQQRTQALAGGHARAAHLDRAIEQLMEDRAGLAYIRPSSAYLRSVYATTSLQSKPDVEWVNLLSRNTQRMFVGETDEFEKAYRETRGEIDKQHWQNINTVNLAGGGNTNYALAKDDIGNWYVKSYSANPEAIFRSAQGLALFGLGKGLDINLLRRVQLQRQLDATSPRDTRTRQALRAELDAEQKRTGAATNDSLSRVHEQYRNDYYAATGADVEDLLKELALIRGKLVGAWDAALKDPTKNETATRLQAQYLGTDAIQGMPEVAAAHELLTKAGQDPAKSEQARAAERAQAIVQALDGLRRLRDRLNFTIQGNDELVRPYRETAAGTDAEWKKKIKEREDADKTNPTAPQTAELRNQEGALATKAAEANKALAGAVENRSIAARTAAVVVNEVVAQKTTRRLATVTQLETALNIIGQATGSR